MPKLVIDAAMDAALNYLKGKELTPGLTLCVCAGAPANRAAAVTGGANHLTQVVLATGGTDLTLADGVSGRKLTIAEKADIAVANNGDADHVVIVDDTNIIIQTTCALTALVNTGTVTTQAFDWNIEDAV